MTTAINNVESQYAHSQVGREPAAIIWKDDYFLAKVLAGAPTIIQAPTAESATSEPTSPEQIAIPECGIEEDQIWDVMPEGWAIGKSSWPMAPTLCPDFPTDEDPVAYPPATGYEVTKFLIEGGTEVVAVETVLEYIDILYRDPTTFGISVRRIIAEHDFEEVLIEQEWLDGSKPIVLDGSKRLPLEVPPINSGRRYEVSINGEVHDARNHWSIVLTLTNGGLTPSSIWIGFGEVENPDPITEIAQPPEGWSEKIPWILSGTARLPDSDPFRQNDPNGTMVRYVIDIQNEKLPIDHWQGVLEELQTYNEEGDVIQVDSATIWRIVETSNTSQEPPAGWIEGNVGWAINLNEIELPTQSPAPESGNSHFVITFDNEQGEGQRIVFDRWALLLDSIRNDELPQNFTIWFVPDTEQTEENYDLFLPLIMRELPYGSVPSGFADGNEPWVLDGSFQLPQEDPTGEAPFGYQVDIENESFVVDTWQEVLQMVIGENGHLIRVSIWKLTKVDDAPPTPPN